MAEDLAELEKTLNAILAGVAPESRRRATRAIAGELRRAQALRIAAQVDPDGIPFEPRKPRLASHHKGVAGIHAELQRLIAAEQRSSYRDDA